VADIQARHARAVLANQLKIATNWGSPCLGYLLMFRPDQTASARLASIQEQILAVEPALLRQPESQLHCSIAWVLPVSRDFEQPKDDIWAERGQDWLKIIGAVTDATAPMRLRYHRLVVTDGAIIAVAAEPNPVDRLRRDLIARLDLPWPITYPATSLVHTTLFRYRQPLADPGALLDRLRYTEVAVDTGVTELLLTRETTFPTLDYEIVGQLPLGSRR
jgi:hypothetical protein